MADAREVIRLPVERGIDDVTLEIQALDGQYERGLEGEPAEIDIVEEPEPLGQVVAQRFAVDIGPMAELTAVESRFDLLSERIGDFGTVHKARLVEPVVELIRQHAFHGMGKVADSQPLVRLDFLRVDETIGPFERGVGEQFAADASRPLKLLVIGPVIEMDILAIQDGPHDILPVEPVARDIGEHRGGIVGAEQLHDVVIAVDLEVIGRDCAVACIHIGHIRHLQGNGCPHRCYPPVTHTRTPLPEREGASYARP